MNQWEDLERKIEEKKKELESQTDLYASLGSIPKRLSDASQFDNEAVISFRDQSIELLSLIRYFNESFPQSTQYRADEERLSRMVRDSGKKLVTAIGLVNDYERLAADYKELAQDWKRMYHKLLPRPKEGFLSRIFKKKRESSSQEEDQ